MMVYPTVSDVNSSVVEDVASDSEEKTIEGLRIHALWKLHESFLSKEVGIHVQLIRSLIPPSPVSGIVLQI